MPAVSRAQAIAARIATNNPDALYARNAGLRSMNLKDLAHLAQTPSTGLPLHVTKKGKAARTTQSPARKDTQHAHARR